MKKGFVLLVATLGTQALVAGDAFAQEVPRFGIREQSFNHSGSYSNPYTAVTATATLNRPGGGTRTIPLFWDGGTTWRMRFSPDVTGSWTWSISSNDAGLNGQSGSFTCVSSTLRGGIRARPSFRYHFERQDGTPFWWMGDTEWSLYGNSSSEDHNRMSAFHYIDVRSAQGFNVVHSNLMGWSNEGGAPFTSTSSESVNPAYWQEVDTRLAYLNTKGITAGLVLAWAQGWAQFASDTARRRYARYVAARYAARNVYFIVSGEWNEWLTESQVRLLGNEIAANDPHDRLTGVHGTDGSEAFAADAWMSFGDYQQLYTNLHGNILAARDHNKPVVNSEYAYYLRDMDGDGLVDKPNSATLQQIRNATYDIVMAGGYFVTGFGTTYLGGQRDPGPFNVDASKNDDWEEDVRHVRSLFTGLEWWKLQPSDTLLGGSGTRHCLAEIGRQYVAYVRGNSGTNSVSLGGTPAATFSVRRFDPRTGNYAALGNFVGAGPIQLDPPDSQDWIFVIVRTGGGLTADFPPEADTYVNQSAPDTNYGGAANIAVGGGTVRREIYLRFNVAGLPAGVMITDARLILTASNPSTATGGTIRRFAPSAEQWSEMAATWNNPVTGMDASPDLATLGPVVSGNMYQFTGLQGAVPGNGRVTFVIRSNAQDGAAYRSKEDPTPSLRPVLRVTYATGSPLVTINSVSTGEPYALGTAQVGALLYIDRAYTISSISSVLAGGVLIRTANDDKYVTTASHLTFTVSAPATVYVCYDDRATALPAWLDDGSWTLTSHTFNSRRVYSKSVPAGPVTLGGNSQVPASFPTWTGRSNYVVIVKP